VVPSIGAPSEDDKMLLDCHEHVSCQRIYFLIEPTICNIDFCFCTYSCFIDGPDSCTSFGGSRVVVHCGVGGG
jgi:hypothetical protein